MECYATFAGFNGLTPGTMKASTSLYGGWEASIWGLYKRSQMGLSIELSFFPIFLYFLSTIFDTSATML